MQAWWTLRFDDHQGILPSEVVVDNAGMHAKLTRSKVSGPDQKVVFRIVVVDAGAFVQHRDWLTTGWKVLCEAAPYDQDFDRDYLIPAPTNNYKGCKNAELQYHTAFAIQSRISAHAPHRGQRIFNFATPHHCTLHSGRNYLPSAAAVLNFPKTERDIFGGWASEGNERYTCVAKYRIAVMQRVAEALQKADQKTLLQKVTRSMFWTPFFVRKVFQTKRERGRKNCFAVAVAVEHDDREIEEIGMKKRSRKSSNRHGNARGQSVRVQIQKKSGQR